MCLKIAKPRANEVDPLGASMKNLAVLASLPFAWSQ